MKRIEMITTKRSEIICYYDELDIIPETSFAQDLINDEVSTSSLSGVRLKQVEQLRSQLSTQKERSHQEATDLWEQITILWDRLDVENNERDELRRKCGDGNGIKPKHIEELKKTLTALQRLKLANLQRLTEGLRCEIIGYYEKCYYSTDERTMFTPAYDENYTEELLIEHEEELERIKTYYNDNKEMFLNVEKWNKLFVKLLEMEAKSQDPNRYNNRGGGLLQEEKERKKIIRQLPKIEEELFAAIEIWEEQNSKPFLVEGTRFSDYVHSQWECHEMKKKNEKTQRQEKKQQELKMEMTFGSTPKTPTKRRLLASTTLSTTTRTPQNTTKRLKNDNTLMRTPNNNTTQQWKTPSVGLQQTPRSVGRPSAASSIASNTRTMRSTRKTKASTNNLKTPSSSSVKKLKVEVTPVSARGRSPLRSSINTNLDDTVIDAFSTTVVQQNQNKATKVQDLRSTPYSSLRRRLLDPKKFAKEITSNAENKGAKVRSSAIDEYSRF